MSKSLYSEQLHIAELPIEVTPAELQMMWHERKQRDPGHEWMRSQIAELCDRL